MFAFTAEGVRIAHLGDLGMPLNELQKRALADAEVVLIPVGGHFAIDAQQASDVVRELPKARLVFPMHFKTDRTADWPIAPVDDFERTMDNVRHIGSSEVTLAKDGLPESLEVWILDYAGSRRY